MVYESCSELTIALAWIGGIVIYLLIGALISCIVSELVKNASKDDRTFCILLSVVLWPLVTIAIMIYVVGMWILFPLIGATRRDVEDAENRVNDRIDTQCTTSVDVSDDDLDIFTPNATKFKAGDVITGISRQTDYNGNSITYEHLYQGCRCRVIRIKEDGAMRVMLIGHKDKEAHNGHIGEKFNAPARNFTLVRKPAKRKAVKKKAKK